MDSGKFRSALEHYLGSGIHYAFLPVDPQVNELWYLVRYPDVSDAIRAGRVRSAKTHFLEHGYRRGGGLVPMRERSRCFGSQARSGRRACGTSCADKAPGTVHSGPALFLELL